MRTADTALHGELRKKVFDERSARIGAFDDVAHPLPDRALPGIELAHRGRGLGPMLLEAALAWQKRSLDYADAPLAEIVADFNRYNQHRLVIVDPALAKRRFGGTFPAGDYRSLVHVLEETFDVVAERRERETILRLR
jgi:transmembrane sensor